ncbi:hypothetical protein [Algicella marina]|uniref:Uncharacterized protein n=1 Tax=Algicella marina TaxID=2683284 RepID=A0A6P1T5B7_9RHOB|nr:hypothetical protein [Algicella marina]QHQ36676.1 hypothetical protein GO499_16600 [Algicella marina]
MKIRVHIGEIVSDSPGLSRREIAAALEAEIGAHVATHGLQALGGAGTRAHAVAEVPSGRQNLSSRVAAATVKAVQG